MEILLVSWFGIAAAAVGFATGALGGWRAARDRYRELPPIEADEIDRLEPHHSTWCEWDEYEHDVWRCHDDCPANKWRIKNAGRRIVDELPVPQAQLPVAKIARDMTGATVINLSKRRKRDHE